MKKINSLEYIALIYTYSWHYLYTAFNVRSPLCIFCTFKSNHAGCAHSAINSRYMLNV